MKFSSGEEMFKELDLCDLYCPEQEIYLFLYNEDGAICSYHIPHEKALELQARAKVDREYWGAYLGWGGCIYDPPHNIEYCNKMYTEQWIDTDEVSEKMLA